MNKKALFPLISLFLLVTGIVLPGSAHAQISEGGTPASFKYQNTLKSDLPTVQIPINFSVEDMKTVDRWQVSQGAPLKVSQLIPTDLSIDNAGNWTTLPGGEKIWQLRLQAKDAIALMLYYKEFYIPKGGRLFIYNANKSHVIGAFTHANSVTSKFATEFVAGDDIILEYEATANGEKPRIRIENVGYGYNHLSISNGLEDSDSELSGPCMVNINCEEGDEWQNQGKGVCMMVMKIGKRAFLCSGSLVNNTARDKKPYVLSAFHCTEDLEYNVSASKEDYNQWMFYFHLEHTGCDNTSPIQNYKTIQGCSRVVAIPVENGSDGLLLLLNENIPDYFDVYFNGWDRTNSISLSGVGIHHPGGDVKKISTYGNHLPSSATWLNSDSNKEGAQNAHWNIIFDETSNGHSVTEGGSSGSPIFNQNKLIIGTLSGGNSTCDNPEGINLYGKLFYHWDKYSQADTGRMDKWLDPIGSGVTSLNGMSQSGKEYNTSLQRPTEVKATLSLDNTIKISWKEPVYKQIIGWGSQEAVYIIGLEGEPFYVGQRWEAKELKAIDTKTITSVNFFPEANVNYSVHIMQGDRTYKQDVISYDPHEICSVLLKTPFTIDANQDLIVALHVKEYNETTHPIYLDKGPAIDQKGNLFSMDGKTWELFPDNIDCNIVLSATVSSEEGKVTQLRSLGTDSKSITIKKSTHSFDVQESQLRSLVQEGNTITAFPEITQYNIYKNNTKLASIAPTEREYTDKQTSVIDNIYGVSAQYGVEESDIKDIIYDASVDIENITLSEISLTPTIFKEQIQLTSNKPVDLLEVFSIDGKKVMYLKYPGNTIQTDSLPSGIYIFRIYTDGNIKVMKLIKK
ncbi:T9SS type A sorting domain-containing protein [Parabacteroides johnsonii]|uniref:T9SS type A sorting domain-containing protein n=1 Tax=Parabacteroides johnsonii TaxID=387661 RepID=UPI00242B82D4|nr:T9SS type A sorting domain-containing protein [Parabacteroides johnsonii]